MKKTVLLTTIFFVFTSLAYATEKNNCSDIKKISKAYIACKAGNVKAGMEENNITQTGTNVTKGILNKVKNFGKKINNPFKKN